MRNFLVLLKGEFMIEAHHQMVDITCRADPYPQFAPSLMRVNVLLGEKALNKLSNCLGFPDSIVPVLAQIEDGIFSFDGYYSGGIAIVVTGPIEHITQNN